MVDVRYKGVHGKRLTLAPAASTAQASAPAEAPQRPPAPRSAPPAPQQRPAHAKRAQHPRDRIAAQLKAKPLRAKEIKRIGMPGKGGAMPAPLTREQHVARLLEIARKRGRNALVIEIETHERKAQMLREALAQLDLEEACST